MEQFINHVCLHNKNMNVAAIRNNQQYLKNKLQNNWIKLKIKFIIIHEYLIKIFV